MSIHPSLALIFSGIFGWRQGITHNDVPFPWREGIEGRGKRQKDVVWGSERSLAVLVIRCSACKRKLWKYDKIGQGEVLRCHKDRIARMYEVKEAQDKVTCPCGKPIGIDKGSHIKMIAKAFTYSGTKRNS
jgi:hypothetical protein